MNYIVNNPYRILGVLSNSSTKEIVSNYGKIKAFAKTKKAISFDNDFVTFLGDVPRDSDSVAKAYNAITLPKDKLIAGFFWFAQVTELDAAALTKLKEGDVDAAISILRKEPTITACVNLAVIHLVEQKWTTALYYYTYLLKTEEKRKGLLSLISDNDNLLSEQELVEVFVEKLISIYPQVVWVESIHQHEVSIGDNVYNIKNFFGNSNVYKCLLEKSNDKIIKLLKNSISLTSSVTKKDANANLQAARQLEKDSKFALKSLRLSLGKDNKEYIALCDKVATTILDRCIDYYNRDQENPKRSKNIIQLLRFAMRTAESRIPKERCRKNFEQIKKECDALLPDEIEAELAYIRKQIAEFKRLNSVSEYSGYLNATIGLCYQKMEIIKTKVGPASPHYIKISSEVVIFALDIIHVEVEKKYKEYQSTYNNQVATSNLRATLEWARPIYDSLKLFSKDDDCSNRFSSEYNSFSDIYKKIQEDNTPKESRKHEYKVITTVPSVVEKGQQFRLLYTLNYRGEEKFIAPSLTDFIIYKGPQKSYSINNVIKDGKRVPEPATTYHYMLEAERTGLLKIGTASFIIDNATYQSSPITIKVVGIESTVNVEPSSEEDAKDNKETPVSNQLRKSNDDTKDQIIFKLILFVPLVMTFGFIIYLFFFTSKKESDKEPLQPSLVQSVPFEPAVDSHVNTNTETITYEGEVSASEVRAPEYEIVNHKTGDKPYSSYYGRGRYDGDSKNSLRIKNGSTYDAVVFLESLKGKKIRHVYIRKSESFNMTQIPAGQYIIKFILGNEWNPEKYNAENAPKGGFMVGGFMSKSESTDAFDYPDPDSGHYYEYEVTLYKVVDGNMHTESITASEMF